MARRVKKKGIPKLNLIPILDSVFIFIFFLLMSAQFVELYEIGTDAPMTSTSVPQDKKPPLNLTLEIKSRTITVKTGVPGKNVKVINDYKNQEQLSELRNLIIGIKLDNNQERAVTLKPHTNVDYEEIVKIIDIVRQGHNQDGQNLTLFDQVVFDTLI